MPNLALSLSLFNKLKNKLAEHPEAVGIGDVGLDGTTDCRCAENHDPVKCIVRTRFDVYETLCPQQMLVHKGGQIKNWSGECKDFIPTKLQCQTIQRTLQSPNLQREIIRKK